jgi:hypothetical protein
VFGVLADPAFPGTPSTIADLQRAALALGLQLLVVNARTDSDLETAFAAFSQQRVGAVLLGTSNFYVHRLEQLAALAARQALPTMFPYREYPLVGGLMSYGSSLGYVLHQAGIYTGRILKGDKPADLPVQQATKLDLVINLKTAKALGLRGTASAARFFSRPCIFRGREAAAGPDWAHEIKRDGSRLMVHGASPLVRRFTRRGSDWTERYPAIAGAAAKLAASSFPIDGEAVVCGSNGVAVFDALHRRQRIAILSGFDLLELDGEDLRPLPLGERKVGLAKPLGRKTGGIFKSRSMRTGPPCSGMPAKSGWRGSVEAHAPSRNWIKVKNRTAQRW